MPYPLRYLRMLALLASISLPGLHAAESAAPLKAANLLANARPEIWQIGKAPPKPWQVPNPDPDISTVIVDREGAKWVELRDSSTEKAASLRQQFPPLKAGRLSFRIAVAGDHVGQFGIFLGQGNASAEVERIVELKVDSKGIVLLGSGGNREKTAFSLTAGVTDHLFVDFSPSNEDLNLSLGRIEKNGTAVIISTTTILQQAHAVTRLRIATDLAPRGAHFFLTDLVLTAAPSAPTP